MRTSSQHATHAKVKARAARRFGEIPPGTDVLLTHGPAFGVLDRCGVDPLSATHWGGSRALLAALRAARPTAHLFGHLHEQRGFFRRAEGSWEGKVEYEASGKGATWGPPPADYPCDFLSCNAMKNHPRYEGRGARSRIAGPARLIFAEKGYSGAWKFTLG